jgi:hypothetical protein
MRMKNIFFIKNLNNLLLCFVLAIPLYFLYLSWNTLIIDHMGFRQTQTALTTFWISSSQFFEHITPVFGYPWLVPLEYPIYQIMVSALSDITSLSIEKSAKLLSILSFYLSLLPIQYLLKEQIKDHILFYVFYLSSPVLLFFSHTFLIESFAFLLAVSVLASFVLFAEKQSLKSAFLFICIATLCGLQKITGLMAALIGCGVYSLFILSNTNKSHFVRKISTLSIVFIISIILPVAWVIHTDELKVASYITSFLTSDALSNWNHGTLSQRFDIFNLAKVFGFRLAILGGVVTLIARLIFYRLKPLHSNSIAISSLCAGFFGPVVFFNLYLVHDYYMVASIGFIGLGLYLLPDLKKVRFNKAHINNSFLIFLTLSINLSIFLYWYAPKIDSIPESHQDMYATAQIVKTKVKSDEVILTAGVDWDSTIPYYTQRYSLMLPSWERNDFAPTSNNEYFNPIYVLENLEEYLDNKTLGAIIICKTRIAEDYNISVNYIKNNWMLTWNKVGDCSYGIIEN